MFDLLEYLLYGGASVGATAAWSYLDGRAKVKFAKREIDVYHPYKLGIATGILWPLQLLLVLIYLAIILPHRVGEERGVLRDEELTRLRQQDKAILQERQKMFRMIAQGVDPTTVEGKRQILGVADTNHELPEPPMVPDEEPNHLDDVVAEVFDRDRNRIA